MTKPKILVVRKMSALEYYYNGNHADSNLHACKKEQDLNNTLIENILKREGCEYNIVNRKQLAGWMVNKYDYVFSAGGDGTAIAAAYFNHNKPQLNLRNDPNSKGALCQHDIEPSIMAVLNGNFKLENWTRQDVFLNSEFLGTASNEVVIGEQLKICKYAKYNLTYGFGNNLKEEFQGNSGIVICTGTGSTGWPGAFDPFPKNSKELRFATAFGAKGSKSGAGDYFKLEYQNHIGKFVLDCADELEYNLPRGSILEVRVSQSPLNVIIPGV